MSSLDVDSRMYNEDMLPIIGKDATNEDYHLGMISSSFSWAQHDISTRFIEELERLFPDAKEFEFNFEFRNYVPEIQVPNYLNITGCHDCVFRYSLSNDETVDFCKSTFDICNLIRKSSDCLNNEHIINVRYEQEPMLEHIHESCPLKTYGYLNLQLVQ